MCPTYTTHYNLSKPLVNDPTDEDLWGGYLNDDMDTIDAALYAIRNALYPVGSLYFNANVATNPATLLGFGTWTAFGAGQVPLGVGTFTDIHGGVAVISAGQQLGEYNHTLTSNEMPTHTHTDSGHTHIVLSQQGSVGKPYNGATGSPLNAWDYTSLPTLSSHANIQNTGGGASHNNCQPSIGVYIWLRTA